MMTDVRRPRESAAVAQLRRRPMMAEMLWRVATYEHRRAAPTRRDVITETAPATVSRRYAAIADLIGSGLLRVLDGSPMPQRLRVTAAGWRALDTLGYLRKDGAPR